MLLMLAKNQQDAKHCPSSSAVLPQAATKMARIGTCKGSLDALFTKT